MEGQKPSLHPYHNQFRTKWSESQTQSESHTFLHLPKWSQYLYDWLFALGIDTSLVFLYIGPPQYLLSSHYLTNCVKHIYLS